MVSFFIGVVFGFFTAALFGANAYDRGAEDERKKHETI